MLLENYKKMQIMQLKMACTMNQNAGLTGSDHPDATSLWHPHLEESA
jgi:hypothetical protein